MKTLALAVALLAFPQGYAPFDGTWSCTSDAGPTSTYAFAMSPDGAWLVMRAGAGTSTFVNRYHRGASGAWVTTQYGSDGSTYQGHSDGWETVAPGKAQSLTFEGVARTTETQTHTRQTWIANPDGTLQRIWSDLDGATWKTTRTTTCTKT